MKIIFVSVEKLVDVIREMDYFSPGERNRRKTSQPKKKMTKPKFTKSLRDEVIAEFKSCGRIAAIKYLRCRRFEFANARQLVIDWCGN